MKSSGINADPKRGHDVLVVFTRVPEPGRTKTRLIPALGAEGAAALHRAMVHRTLDTARAMREYWPCVLEVALDGGSPEASRDWLGPDVDIAPQGEGSLGERMARVFENHFRAGASRVVLVGTDVPALTPAILTRAFQALDVDDVALGPARDGGYYLVALRRPVPHLFEGIAWGGPDVFAATLARAASAGLSVARLDVLSDVDTPEDLAVWRQA